MRYKAVRIEQTQSTISRVPVQDQFTWFLKAVLVHPGLDLAVNDGDVLDPEVHGATLETHHSRDR